MKFYMPLISAIFFGLGFLVASKVKENELGGIVEQSVVLESALETRVHTVLLTRLREGKVEESISTLENSLGIKEVLLETYSTPSCSVAMTREVIEAKKLIEDYRKAYSSSKQ